MAVYIEGIVLEMGASSGALVVYCKKDQRGKTIDLHLDGVFSSDKKLVANVVGRMINGREEFAAVFPHVPVGTHLVWNPKGPNPRVTIFAGQVAEIDWR